MALSSFFPIRPVEEFFLASLTSKNQVSPSFTIGIRNCHSAFPTGKGRALSVSWTRWFFSS